MKVYRPMLGMLCVATLIVGCGRSASPPPSARPAAPGAGGATPRLSGGGGVCAQLSTFYADVSRVQTELAPAPLKADLATAIARYQPVADAAPPGVRDALATFVTALKGYQADITPTSPTTLAGAQARADATFAQKSGPAVNTIARFVATTCTPAS